LDSVEELLAEGRVLAKSNVDLTPEVISFLGAVHGTFLENNGIIVTGRDYRRDARMLKRAYTSGAMSTGIDLLDLHVAPLPLLQFCIRRFGASGGVYFTSGHSNYEDIGIRFFNSLGIEFPKSEMDRMVSIWSSKDIKRVPPGRVGRLSTIPHTQSVYQKAVPAFVDRKLVKGKIVLDCSYGPSGEISPPLLSGLNIEIISLNTFIPDEINVTMPNYRSIKEVSGIVKASNSDIGVVMDVDGSRAVYIDETGTIVDYDQLLGMLLMNEKSIKNNRQSPVILSRSCSKIIYDICKQNGQQFQAVDRVPGLISEKIREYRAIFGASETGKFYFAEYGPFSDANLTTLKILEIMGETGLSLSKLIREAPKPIRFFKELPLKEEVIGKLFDIFNPVHKKFEFSIADTLYGVKLTFEPGSWVLVKPALHREAMELYAESPSKATTADMVQEIETILLNEEQALSESQDASQ
jgi:phosphomannomutase